MRAKLMMCGLAMMLFANLSCPSLSLASETATLAQHINEIEGVYKHRFKNGLVTGESYQSEDIIEVIRYSRDAVYFRASLQFFNGHACGIYGIARYADGAFIYKSGQVSQATPACTLKLSVDKHNLHISDRVTANSASTCSAFCGARGSLGHYEISRNKKRKIRYMPLILKSQQYSEAVNDYQKTSSH